MPTQRIPSKPSGNSHAFNEVMSGARGFEELVSWQRMHELNVEVWNATEHGRVSRDFDFRNQIREAADSAERNIAEGFSRCNPVVFANFLEFSRTAACTTRSLLRKGLDGGYLSADQFNHLDQLAIGALRAIVNFQRYLRSPAAKRHAPLRYPRPYSRSA